MSRKEFEIMDNWKFCLNENKPNYTEFYDILLPHDWAISQPLNKDMIQGKQQGFFDRWGIGWYYKSLSLQKEKGHCYYLDFGGIFENSTIYINDKEAGGNKYGYSSFRLDISDYIINGENKILIKVDNSIAPVDRWYSGCGIYRTVKFIDVNERHFSEQEIIVKTQLNENNAIININTGVSEKVQATIRALGIVKTIYTTKKTLNIISTEVGNNQVQLHIENPILWSCNNPYLYELELNLLKGNEIADTVKMNIGIREVVFDSKKGMIVNGIPTKLKGVCLHQDIASVGIATKKEMWAERLVKLKEMGCNTIRCAHHTHSSEFMDLCDEMGFYVYEEAFDKWTGGLYGKYFDTQWKNDINAMVKRDRNRPSVVIWGVGNEVENQAQDSMLKILEMLYNYVKSLDSSKPITYAMNPHFKRERNIDMSTIKDIQKFVDEVDNSEILDNDEKVQQICKIGAIVDIISCNYQEQWYHLIHEKMPNKLILGTEVYQYFRGDENNWANFTDKNPSLIIEEQDSYIGSIIWSGYDYLGESMTFPAKGWTGSLIRTNGEVRDTFYILQSYWSEKPMVHFSVLDYSIQSNITREHWYMPNYVSHWHFPQFEKALIPYMISSNCETVKLYINDMEYMLPKPADCSNRVLTGFIPWEKGAVTVIGYNNGLEASRYTLKTPLIATKLDFDIQNQTIIANKGYELMLTIRAKDINNTPCFRESTLVKFFIEGDAEIIATDNGNLFDPSPYNLNYIHLHRGVASVIIRLKDNPNKVKISAIADGMIGCESILNITN